QLAGALEGADQVSGLLVAMDGEPRVGRARSRIGRPAHFEDSHLLVGITLLDHQRAHIFDVTKGVDALQIGRTWIVVSELWTQRDLARIGARLGFVARGVNAEDVKAAAGPGGVHLSNELLVGDGVLAGV